MPKSLGSEWKWYKGYEGILSPHPCYPSNCEYLREKIQTDQKTKKIQKKGKFCFTTFKNKLSEYDEWRVSWPFYDGGPYHMFLSL